MNNDFVSTGIAGLNEILGGTGFVRNRLYLLQGDPGTGKTTVALQILLEAARQKERTLYITLSESRLELDLVAKSHGWDLASINLFELSAIENQLQQVNTVFEPAEIELDQTTGALIAEIERVKPTLVVFDSLSELRLLAQNALRYRKQLLAFKQYFHKNHATVFFVDDNTGISSDDQVLSIAHGVVSLEKVTPDYGAQRRRVQVVKMRGSSFRSGFHDFVIQRGGVVVFPRLIASEHISGFRREIVSSGLASLDNLLKGGLDRGTSALFIGPAGSGKSTLAMQFAVSAARAGEKSAVFTFDENLETLQARCRGVIPGFDQFIDSGKIDVQQINPAEITPGEFAYDIKELVSRESIKIVFIDSLNGYLNAMPDQRFLLLHLHELLSFLNQQGVTTLVTVAQHGILGSMQSPVDLTYLADTVILLRFFEHESRVKKAISVVKKRSGAHEDTIREFRITSRGIEVGDPMLGFSGVLTGTPVIDTRAPRTPDRLNERQL